MINVVQIVEDLKPGGLERVIENIAMHSDTDKFRISVLCLSRGGEIAEKLISAGRDVEVLGINSFHNPLSFTRAVKWLKKKKVDIVHTHGYPAGVLGRIAAIIAGVPCIVHHVHSTYTDLNRRHHFTEKILSWFSSVIICCSEAVRRFVLENENIASDKVTVIYNGVSNGDYLYASEIAELKSTLGFPEDNIIVGCVASLTEHKGHRYLLEAFRETDNAALLIIGEGPRRRELESLCREFGISNRAIFTGHKMDVFPYISLMDIAVLPSSEREGLGISVIEAMALSKPVIATSVGGLTEVVEDGKTGILVEAKNSKAIASALSKLLMAPHLRESMGAKGRERYEKMFSLNDMLKKMEELYVIYHQRY
jgi:glycosyltransferase involved in cell wall biosynthesis